MNTLKGKKVSLDRRFLHVELADRRVISTPLAWYPELQKAPPQRVRRYRFICKGTGIEWPAIDYHLSIESMLVGNRKKEAA